MPVETIRNFSTSMGQAAVKTPLTAAEKPYFGALKGIFVRSADSSGCPACSGDQQPGAFRVGCIGAIDDNEMRNLVTAIGETLWDIGIALQPAAGMARAA